MLIELKQIHKNYNNVNALNDINLTFEEGKTTVLIGPSGCGKSTLIRIIIGLIKKDSGEVVIDNKEISSVNLSKIRRQMGYVIQDGGLFPHLTASKNVSLLSEYIGWEKNKINEKNYGIIGTNKIPFGWFKKISLRNFRVGRNSV